MEFYQDVDQLQQHGINVAEIKKLQVFVSDMFFSYLFRVQAAGICTIKGIMMTTKKRLCDIKGLSEAKVDKIKESAAKLMVC